MSNGSDHRESRNIPATVQTIMENGEAIVRVPIDAGPFSIGHMAPARLRIDRSIGTSKPQDFNFLYKKGLRGGGTVMLHRALLQEDGSISASRIVTLRAKPDLIGIRVLPGTMCCVLPPPNEDSLMVEETILSLTSLAVPVRAVSEAFSDIELALEESCLYGQSGILFRGPDAGGAMRYFIVRPEESLQPDELLDEFAKTCPKDLLKLSREHPGWHIVPIAAVPVDPDRQTVLSAQAANYPYIDPDSGSARFTWGTATLRLIGETWAVSDATPLSIKPAIYGFDWPNSPDLS